MAFKPSNRRTVKVESTELDLRPIMNMMCILIPLLLSCSQFVKNTFLELNLPQLGGFSKTTDPKSDPKDEKPKLGLKLVITGKGMTIAGNAAVLSGGAAGVPTIPIKDGKQDFKGLDDKLKEIVKQISGRGFEDERTLNITAEDIVEYQVIVTAMDVIRMSAEKKFKDQGTGQTVTEPWFASVGVGKLIL